jgi:hypothetical protein
VENYDGISEEGSIYSQERRELIKQVTQHCDKEDFQRKLLILLGKAIDSVFV